jgi:hypothetical protein|tara:strand:+ start:192 stop:374 length:183 start_codon:yes stop_codon:yes gene_type:complete
MSTFVLENVCKKTLLFIDNFLNFFGLPALYKSSIKIHGKKDKNHMKKQSNTPQDRDEVIF